MSRKKIKNSISFLGPVLSGTISEARSKCGKITCRCQTNPKFLHGPYYRWTGVIDGKSATVTLTKEEAKECEMRIKNWKRLQEKITLIREKAIARAPWTDRK